MAGLRVGQGYEVFHRPGFGSLVPVPRCLGTQPPFVTQALMLFNDYDFPCKQSWRPKFMIRRPNFPCLSAAGT